ncbi:phosphate acyltransferase PlsX [Chromohalobacter sp. HP20-39]|uniref:phosphate acyltransferase PlsX n=1 Tax=Chromohalobacter sp. HP20-39 TaxID=3079306 RepID=UPI00294AE756|nr:phosphate acyltransferase PlsX [Chromohalobacter sp. HP20-39]MDV6319951.1 phosphate acyltransferase PlsX [Chromohalobacter sp. HP20-39]
MRIAIDAMGGDMGPRATVIGSLQALAMHSNLEIQLHGPRDALEAELESLPKRLSGYRPRLVLQHAPRVISQAMKVANALREADGSSMLGAITSVRDGHAHACVSAGNTGALMALARRELGTVTGIARPAISTAVPTQGNGQCYLLDLGANVDVQARHLVDFARMGAVMARVIDDLSMPRVALLNIGVEANKGVPSVREADKRLREGVACHRVGYSFEYIGYLEGDGVFSGEADVVVCDGFVGNAVLKASEGLATMLMSRLQTTFEAHLTTRVVRAMAWPALLRLKRRLDPVRYNGASLLGLAGIVVKSHGSADAKGFAYAISRAVREIDMDLPSHLARELSDASHSEPSVHSVDPDSGRADSGLASDAQSDDSHPQR